MFNKIIPRSLKIRIRKVVKKWFHFKEYDEYYQVFLDERAKKELAIPSSQLLQKHITNLEVLTDREQLLQRLPKNVVCAEIGVNRGEFSTQILQHTNPQKLHLIDAWGNPPRYHNGLKSVVSDKFKNEIEAGKVEIHQGFSTNVLAQMSDHYFDWVYLDTDHSYGLTADELVILKDKIKAGGIIAGHDYIIGNWKGDVRYGVIEAVHEFCVKENWEILFITINVPESPSFAIRKIA